MTREEKNQFIESLTQDLNNSKYFYIADISDLNSEATTRLRGMCFKKDIKLKMVKNSLLRIAMEKADKNLEPLYDVLKGTTSLMFAEAGNTPAVLIKEFRKKSDRPILKGAYVEECVYIGDDQLDALVDVKSKNELIADVVTLLQSPAKNVISALMSGGQIISGIVKTLSEKE